MRGKKINHVRRGVREAGEARRTAPVAAPPQCDEDPPPPPHGPAPAGARPPRPSAHAPGAAVGRVEHHAIGFALLAHAWHDADHADVGGALANLLRQPAPGGGGRAGPGVSRGQAAGTARVQVHGSDRWQAAPAADAPLATPLPCALCQQTKHWLAPPQGLRRRLPQRPPQRQQRTWE